MAQIYVDHVTHSYASRLVLNDVSWEIQAGQKIGLVGPNGAGKSTLLRFIAGELLPEKGTVIRQRGLRIGYLAQTPVLDPACTVWEEVFGAMTALREVETRMRRLEERLADPAVYGDEEELERALQTHARVQAEFEQLDGYRYEGRVREVLLRLGFRADEFELPIDVLSGGQKKLVGLAKLLVFEHDVLLLDEPDNHLDLDGKAELEQLIQSYPGTVILVSHDRYLLDETINTIAEVEDHRLSLWPGTYSNFAVQKQLYLLRQQQLYAAQQKQIARIEAAIARFELWASIVVNERHARQARSRQKMLDRMEKVERPIMDRRRMGLELEGWRGSKKVLEIEDLFKVFTDGQEEQLVLAGVNLLLRHGERVGLIGANGAGKSVLVRCILGQEPPSDGLIKIGPNVRIGYYAQQHETLNPDKTLVEEIRQIKPMYEEEAVAFLGGFLFSYQMVRNRVRDLSGGERSRLQLAKLMLSDANFLLLDEPTNNLDLPSCEVLENALDQFEGTLLVVSHDRYFLDRAVERIAELEDGHLTEYPGNYTYYREQKTRHQVTLPVGQHV